MKMRKAVLPFNVCIVFIFLASLVFAMEYAFAESYSNKVTWQGKCIVAELTYSQADSENVLLSVECDGKKYKIFKAKTIMDYINHRGISRDLVCTINPAGRAKCYFVDKIDAGVASINDGGLE